ncbi:hypothetical protein GCM10009131_12670 [Morganella psychrotolerans]
MEVATKPTLAKPRALTLCRPAVDSYPMDSREACVFMGISYPTLKKWIDAGRLAGARKDPLKPKSPWQFTRANCIAAINYKMHNTPESVISAEEERTCQSSGEVRPGTPVTRTMVKELRSRLVQRTKSKRRSCMINERPSCGV